MAKKYSLRLKNRWAKRLSGYAGTIISQIGFGLATTYIGLSVLAAEEYGVYAIVSIISAMLAALAAGPVGFISAGNYRHLTKNEQAQANATFTLLTLGIAFVEGVMLFTLWPLVTLVTGHELGMTTRYLVCLSIVPQAIVILYTNISYNQGFSGRVLASTFGQGLISLIALYIGLYVLSMGTVSLYLAQLCGVVSAASLCLLLAGRIARPTNEWITRWKKETPTYSVNMLIINIPQFLENVLIARFTGLANVAVWQHARIYNSFVMRAGKIVGLTVLPIALSEAKEGKFTITQTAWRAAYVGFTAIGICAAFLVEPLVDVLTHGKLIAASAIVPWWVIYNLLQNTGREAEATLFSADLGSQVIRAQSRAKVVSFVLLIPLLYNFGLWGALVSAMVEVVYFRFLLRRAALRLRIVPAMDSWAFGGSLIIGIAIFLEHLFSPMALASRLIFTLLGFMLILLLARHILFDLCLLYKSAIKTPLTDSTESL